MSTLDHVLTPGDLFDEWKAKSEGASVRGYAQALELELAQISEQGLSIFTVDLVRRLHQETMDLDPRFRGIPGRLREPGKPGDVVWIRGRTSRIEDSIYNPAPAHRVLACLQGVMDWFGHPAAAVASAAGMGMPLTVRMAIGHAHFEAIHPFSDGNGRVGRMLLALQMACHGKLPLYLSGYIEEHKAQYGHVLQAAQKKLNYTPIVEFFADAIVDSHAEAAHSRRVLQDLPSRWRGRGSFRAASAAVRALDWLMEHPIFTVRQLQEHLRVSGQAANTAVTQLQKARIIRERTGFARNRVFAAEEVISLLSRHFGSDPEEALLGAQALLSTAGG